MWFLVERFCQLNLKGGPEPAGSLRLWLVQSVWRSDGCGKYRPDSSPRDSTGNEAGSIRAQATVRR